MDTDSTYEPAVDISDSKVTEHKNHISLLHKETDLRKHHKITVEKFNVTLRAVTSMVYDDTYPSHKVSIPKLNVSSAVSTLNNSSEVSTSDLFFK